MWLQTTPLSVTLLRWATGRWSNCSIACGQGYQQREVSCVRDISEESFEVVHSSYCSGQDTPSSLQSCEGSLCLHLWVPGPWKEVRASLTYMKIRQ